MKPLLTLLAAARKREHSLFRALGCAVALLLLCGALGCSSPGKPPAKSPPPAGKRHTKLPSREQPPTASPSLAETLVESLQSGSLRRVWTSPAFAGVAVSSGSLFSPDNSRLVLSVLALSGRFQCRIMVAREEEVAALSAGPDDVVPDWNPHSQEVAYLDATDEAGEEKLLVLDTKTSVSRVLKTPAGSLGPPRWSPDGNSIAFGAVLGAGRAPMGLVVVDARRGSTRTIPIGGPEPPDRFPPAWSADGKRVLLIGRGPRSHRCDIWLADLARGSAKLVWSVKEVTKGASTRTVEDVKEIGRELMVGFDQASGDPCLMIRGYSDLTKAAPEGAAVFRYDTRARRVVKVGSLSPPEERRPRDDNRAIPWPIGAAVLSPDGRGLATVAYSGEAHNRATVVWLHDGQHGQEALPDGVTGTVLSWSRDGKRLAVAEEEGERRNAKTRIVVYEFVQ
jgi:dipeptidyl aminopeptidase/acylaminoacyl peptidase